MLSKTEKKIFTFIKELPGKFFIWFWIGIVFYTIKYIVTFLLPLQQKQYLDEALQLKYLWTNGFLILVILFASSIALLLVQYICFRTLRVNLGEYLYKLCLNRILRLPKQTIAIKGTGYYNSVIVNLTQSLSTLVSPTIFDFFFSAIQMIAINVIIFQWNKYIFIVFCIGYVLAAINTFFFHKLRKKYLDEYNSSNTEISAETNDIISNAFTVRSYNVLSFFTRPLWKKVETNKRQLNTFLKLLEINRFIFAVIKTGTFAIMLVMVLDSIFKNIMTYGQLVALISYFESLFIPFHNYVTFLGDMINYGSWLDKYDSAFKDLKKDHDIEDITIEKLSIIKLKDVLISYQKDKTPLNMVINKRTGIVGLTGEGKTSILQLLYRETLPEKGDILINQDIPYNTMPLLNYYNRLNILGQDIEVFNKDLEFNLTLGKNVIDDNDIISTKNNIRELITSPNHITASYDKMPDLLKPLLLANNIIDESGKIISEKLNKYLSYKRHDDNKFIEEVYNYNYVVKSEYDKVVESLELDKLSGRKFGEKGTFISGGEKQKIAFARFLLKNDYDFFILDEPFTSIDAINEKKLLGLLLTKIGNKVGIIISHKFHILEAIADDFIIIHEGVMVNQGPRERLLNENIMFKQLRDEYFNNLILSS